MNSGTTIEIMTLEMSESPRIHLGMLWGHYHLCEPDGKQTSRQNFWNHIEGSVGIEKIISQQS